MTPEQKYTSEEYQDEIYKKVGLHDLAIELNARFIADVHLECEKEYQKTKSILAFKPTERLHLHFIEMLAKSFEAFRVSKLVSSS